MLNEEFERKKRIVYDHTNTSYDKDTGEVKSVDYQQNVRVPTEGFYNKDLYKNIQRYKAWEGIPGEIIGEVLARIQGFVNDENSPLVFVSDKQTRREIAKATGRSERMISRYISQFVKNGYLFETNTRGKYVCNPWFTTRGDFYSGVRKLRKHFDIVNGKWVCDLECCLKNEE